MRGFNVLPSSVTYGILIKAFGITGDLDRAFKMYSEMQRQGLTANNVTFGCLLDACVKNGDVKRAEHVFTLMRRDKVPMNTVLYTTLMKGYSREWQLEKACSLYE